MKNFMRPVLKCPVCGRRDQTIFVCSACWQKVPPKDRAQLRTMRMRGQPTASKLASVVRDIRLKNAKALGWTQCGPDPSGKLCGISPDASSPTQFEEIP